MKSFEPVVEALMTHPGVVRMSYNEWFLKLGIAPRENISFRLSVENTETHASPSRGWRSTCFSQLRLPLIATTFL